MRRGGVQNMKDVMIRPQLVHFICAPLSLARHCFPSGMYPFGHVVGLAALNMVQLWAGLDVAGMNLALQS